MKNLSLHCLNMDSAEATIKTLLSAKAYAKQLIAGDLNSSDRLKIFCIENKIKYVKLSMNDNLAQCQNDLIKMSEMHWHMHLNPGETVSNPTKINEIIQKEPAAYKMPCVQSGWLNKEIRLYHHSVRCKFSNPVFESIDHKNSKFLEVYISGGETGLSKNTHSLLKAWTDKQPLSIQPRYYTTLTHLMEGKQMAFVNAAKNYLFSDPTQSIPNTMMRYYLACALASSPQTRQEAAKHVVTCLAASVLMAEFWCLLGDLCHADGSYDKAKAMYRNAIILGSRRHKDDSWPMHIVKYKKHPEAMIAACDESALESKTFMVKS